MSATHLEWLRVDAPRISASWLSEDMAQALAAMCPPLQTADVLRVADGLSEAAAPPDFVLLDGMFWSDAERFKLRNVVEALRALHTLRRGSRQ